VRIYDLKVLTVMLFNHHRFNRRKSCSTI